MCSVHNYWAVKLCCKRWRPTLFYTDGTWQILPIIICEYLVLFLPQVLSFQCDSNSLSYQLHSVSFIKILHFPLYVEFWRHCVYSARTHRYPLPQHQRGIDFKYSSSGNRNHNLSRLRTYFVPLRYDWPPEGGKLTGKWGTECLHTRFLLLSLCAGIVIKINFVFTGYYQQ